jgi:hypothetical protein
MRGAHISHSGIRGDQFAALAPVRERVSGPEHAGTVCAWRELARSTRQVVAADQAWPVPPGRLAGGLTGGLVTVIDHRLAGDGDGPFAGAGRAWGNGLANISTCRAVAAAPWSSCAAVRRDRLHLSRR